MGGSGVPCDDQFLALFSVLITVFDPVEVPGSLVEDILPVHLPNAMAPNDILIHPILSLFIMSVVCGQFPFLY